MLGKRGPWALSAYLAWAALWTLLSARLFYGYMLQQTGGEWSGPLDDVFIHFDYARSTARGYPFQWTEGNGYSSGGTSVLYPLVLAAGYAVGFRGAELMVWAAMLACASVLGLLWSLGGLFRRLPGPSLALLPPALFGVGALSWSLWSGMEVAFFLGVWALGLALSLEVAEERASAAWLGAAGALVVLTRPEGATSVAALGVYAAAAVARRSGRRSALRVLLWTGLPSAAVLVAQAAVNKLLTGESTANGALVKLALYNPYMTDAEKWADYAFNLRYVYDRLTLHHFGEDRPWGRVPIWLGFGALIDRRTRAPALLLLVSGALWVAVVGLNGQVRWQNERYVMPAVAWLLAAAALGVAALTMPEGRWVPQRAVAGALVASFLLLEFWKGERVQYRDQVWFFARASRNIRDQHTTAGRLLRTIDPPPRRLLVGDAGALIYAADVPGFDLIGLGGYRDLPLARAGVHGLPATLELLERMPRSQRPDYMAIYPTWWPALPGWFGQQVASVPVSGNVICGGAEKVIYQADWRLLGTGARPLSIEPGEVLLDEVDVADLVSEKRHGYRFPQPQGGWTTMRVLPDPEAPELDVWDAGRLIPPGRPESFRLAGLGAGKPLRIVLRTAVDRASEIEVAAGSLRKRLSLPRSEGWTEVALDVPADQVTREMDVTVTPQTGEWVNYHVWALGRPLPAMLLTHLERALALAILRSPAPRVVSTLRPRRADGNRLDPQVQTLLRLADLLREPKLHELTVEQARATLLRQTSVVELPLLRRIHTEDRAIDGPAGPINLRIYRPPSLPRPAPALLYFHGGGFVVGDLLSHDPVCRWMAREAQAMLIAVDYRLAPEHPFPAAVDDALAAYRWATERRAELGIGPLGVAGDSAGGCLSAIVAQQVGPLGLPPPALQFLIYPATDLTCTLPSRSTFARGFLLEHDTIDWFIDRYAPDHAVRRDPRASPLLAERVDGLAPALIVTGGFDPLRDEGRRYADRLQEAGVPVDYRCATSLPHGFWSMGGVVDEAREQILALSRRAGELLRGRP